MNNDLEQYAENNFTDLDLEGMAHGNNPVANAYRELLSFRRAAKQAKPFAYYANDAYYNTERAALKDGAEEVTTLYTTPQPPHTEQYVWIKCSERLPEVDEHKPIAIYTGNCIGQGMFVACYDEDGFYDYWDGVEISGISHWMPLPSPPVAAPKPESE